MTTLKGWVRLNVPYSPHQGIFPSLSPLSPFSHPLSMLEPPLHQQPWPLLSPSQQPTHHTMALTSPFPSLLILERVHYVPCLPERNGYHQTAPLSYPLDQHNDLCRSPFSALAHHSVVGPSASKDSPANLDPDHRQLCQGALDECDRCTP